MVRGRRQKRGRNGKYTRNRQKRGEEKSRRGKKRTERDRRREV